MMVQAGDLLTWSGTRSGDRYHWCPQISRSAEVYRRRCKPHVDAVQLATTPSRHDCRGRGRNLRAASQDCEGKADPIHRSFATATDSFSSTSNRSSKSPPLKALVKHSHPNKPSSRSATPSASSSTAPRAQPRNPSSQDPSQISPDKSPPSRRPPSQTLRLYQHPGQS